MNIADYFKIQTKNDILYLKLKTDGAIPQPLQ